MVGMSPEVEVESSDSPAFDESWMDDEVGGLESHARPGVRPSRGKRRSIEELMEERRLRKQLEDVFDEEF